MKKIVIATVVFALAAASCSSAPPREPLKVFSFNLRRFDAQKAAKTKITAFMAGLLRDADIAALQEGIDLDNAQAGDFARQIGGKHAFLLGQPEGCAFFYEEQYLFIYNTARISLEKSAVYPDAGRNFERPPMAALFQADGVPFIVVNCHIKPDDTMMRTSAEIAMLPEVARYFANLMSCDNVLVMGDFNADGAYYDETGLLRVFPPSAWACVIGNDCDTTASANTAFAYDRFFISAAARPYWTGGWDIIRFDAMNECRALTPSPAIDISDHYPIMAEFKTR